MLGGRANDLVLLADDRQRAIRVARPATAVSHHPRHAEPPWSSRSFLANRAASTPWTDCLPCRVSLRAMAPSSRAKPAGGAIASLRGATDHSSWCVPAAAAALVPSSARRLLADHSTRTLGPGRTEEP